MAHHDYGTNDQSPWESVQFYEPNDIDAARLKLPYKWKTQFPDTWRQHSLRVYCRSTSPAVQQAALLAMSKWGKANKLSDDRERVEYYRPSALDGSPVVSDHQKLTFTFFR